MKFLMIALGLLLKQGLPVVEEKFHEVKDDLEDKLKQRYRSFLGAIGALFLFCSSASAFIYKLGENLDNLDGFIWTSSLTLYLTTTLVSFICLIFFAKNKKGPVRILKERTRSLGEELEGVFEQVSVPDPIYPKPKTRKRRK